MASSAITVMRGGPVPRHPSNADEERLIGQVLKGQPDLFADLLEPHRTSLLRFVQAKMRYDPEADDIVQLTIIKAFTRLKEFRLQASFRTWLLKIAINEILQWHRKRGNSRLRTFDTAVIAQLPVVDPSSCPARECQRRETNRLLYIALAKLPPRYQNVIRLRDLEGHSILETAELLNLSVPAAKTRHHRARQKMRRFLGGVLKPALAASPIQSDRNAVSLFPAGNRDSHALAEVLELSNNVAF